MDTRLDCESSSMDWRSTLFIALLLEGLQYSAAQYIIEIPKKLWAIKDSCVVIPCSYNYADPKLSSGDILGMWFDAINENTPYNLFMKSNTPANHASFIGDLGKGICSIKIHQVQPGDTKVYKFRVEMKHFKFSFRDIVRLNVLDNPPDPILDIPTQTLPEATTVTLKCSTTYTCSADIVDLVWTPDEGHVTVTHNYIGEGEWKVESKNVFQLSRNHDGAAVGCRAGYSSGAKSQVITGILSISYKPVILQNSQCKRNQSAINCECAAMANPPANITWSSSDISVTETSGFSISSSSHGSKTVSSLKGAATPAGNLQCAASNMEGSVSHKLPIYEKPHILQESSCKNNLSAIYCECAAIANPPADITWSSNDINVTETSGFSTNSSSHGSKTVSSLEGAMTPPRGLWCTASNTEGSVSHKLPIYDKPEILLESHCRHNLNFISCQCAVTSNSSASIVWGINNHFINQSADGFTMTTSTNGNTTVATIEGTLTFPRKIWCSARNKGGTVLYSLHIYVDWTTLILMGVGILAFLILCIIGAVFAIRKFRSKENKSLTPNGDLTMNTTCARYVSDKDMTMRYEKKYTKDIYEVASQEDSENIYMNSELQQENCEDDEESIYNNVEKEEEEGDEDENEDEEVDYINC